MIEDVSLFELAADRLKKVLLDPTSWRLPHSIGVSQLPRTYHLYKRKCFDKSPPYKSSCKKDLMHARECC